MTEVVASFSGGKDSTAMVLRMIEVGEQLDEVLCCDTGLEFPAMYDHISKVREAVENAGIKFTVLKSDKGFDYYFRLIPACSSKHKKNYHGYGWPNMHMRWCTKYLKTELMNDYLKDRDVIQCTGLAADEEKRIKRKNNSSHRHPLAEWGWNESVCLGYCYGKGYDWYDPATGKGLYSIFSRTSCWLCPLQRIGELRKLYAYYPDLWEELGRMESDLRQSRESEGMPFNTWKYKADASWEQLNARFQAEEKAVSSQKTIEVFI